MSLAAQHHSGAIRLVLALAVWRHPAFDERLDGIVYATRAGLGFALVENVMALSASGSTLGFLGTFVLRAFFSVPCHAIAAGFIGDLAARRRFDGTGPGLLGGFLVAVLLHGSFDVALNGLEVTPQRAGRVADASTGAGVGFNRDASLEAEAGVRAAGHEIELDQKIRVIVSTASDVEIDPDLGGRVAGAGLVGQPDLLGRRDRVGVDVRIAEAGDELHQVFVAHRRRLGADHRLLLGGDAGQRAARGDRLGDRRLQRREVRATPQVGADRSRFGGNLAIGDDQRLTAQGLQQQPIVLHGFRV